SAPQTPAALKGKVVVYDFWTYSCINCRRTFPYVRALYDRYRGDGLVVVGIHTPEFDFEKVRANVVASVSRLGVDWPVVTDNSHSIWDSFANQYWPADYIADRTGHLRYRHFGEGSYSQTEDVVRNLLGLPKSAPHAAAVKNGQAPSTVQINPETYLG